MSRQKAKTKVLMVTMSLKIGGAETHILELAKGLSRKGAEVIVASAGGEYADELISCGVTHYTAPLSNKHPGNMLDSYRILKDIIKKHNIKLVHAHARIPAFICGILCKRLKIRFVTTAHWVFKTSFPYNLLSDWGEAALAVSNDIKDYLVDNYKFDPGRIILTINGIDTEKFSPKTDGSPIIKEFALDPAKKHIININRLDKLTTLAPIELIKAATELESIYKNEFDVIIVGDGGDFKSVKSAADEANARAGRKMVILAGKRTNINQFLGKGVSDIFIGVSRAAMEAMAAEKTVVLAGNEGYMGIFSPDKLKEAADNNFTCRGGHTQTNAKLLVRDISALFEMDGEEIKRLQAFGREVILEHYSVDRMSGDALELYELVTRSSKKYDAVLSGYYGSENSGDDALLAAIIGNLRQAVPGVSIAVLSKKPRETARTHNVKAVNTFNLIGMRNLLRNASLLISGGGTLVQDETSTKSLIYYLHVMNQAKKLGCKVMVYASGVGPLRLEKNRRRAAETLNKADLITLRDEMSLATLKTLNIKKVKTIVTADAVFGLKYKEERPVKLLLEEIGLAEKPFFCVAVRNWKTLKDDFEGIISGFTDYMSKKYGLTALFIPMQPSKDTDISRRILNASQAKGILLNKNLPLDDMLGVVGQSRFALGMRLHILIYAAKMGVPIIGLSYDPKVNGMMEMFSQKYCTGVSDLTLDILKIYADEVMHSRDEISASLLEPGLRLEDKAFATARMAGEIIKD